MKKGGVGGLGMLLAGYCMLSYTWSYPHLSKCVDSLTVLIHLEAEQIWR